MLIHKKLLLRYDYHQYKLPGASKVPARCYSSRFYKLFFDFCIITFLCRMKELRAGIIRLFEQGKSGRQIAKDMNLPQRTVSDAIKRYQETGSHEDRPRSGRPRTARTPANKRKIKARIQRNKNSRKNSTRKMGAALGISEASVRRILHKDLGVKSRKEAEAQNLTNDHIQKRAERCPRYAFR